MLMIVERLTDLSRRQLNSSTCNCSIIMLVNYFIPSSLGTAVLWLAAFVIAKALVNKFTNGLNGVPGPFLAGCTDFWRFFIVWGRRPELVHIELHRKYGSVVRLGPRTVSIADNQAVKAIYGPSAGFTKVRTNFTHRRSGCPRPWLDTTVKTLLCSQDSTPYSRRLQTDALSRVCSIRGMNGSMPISADRCLMPMQ